MDDFRFIIPIEVRYSDLDAQGHLNNAVYFTFMEHGRLKYSLALGLWDPDASFMGVGQILAEAACTFKRPVRLGQVVDVGVRVSRIGNKSAEMEYQLAVDGLEVARGRTVQVAYDYDRGESIPFPAEWRARVAAFEGREF